MIQTSLYDWHLQNSGKIVDFNGYALPVQYDMGQVKEHLHCRSQAGLFDVSHMGQVSITGEQVAAELEAILPLDTDKLQPMKQCYTVLLNANGGVIDDVIVCKISQNHYRIVLNASRKQTDIAWIKQHLSTSQLNLHNELSLLALQGPKARQVLTKFCDDIAQLKFHHSIYARIQGMETLITCCGYTGEDGFEMCIDNKNATTLANLLSENTVVKPCGLGARDTLRLEAGLCLYGNDLNEQTTPIEADLRFTIAPSRRPNKAKAGGYIGSQVITKQMTDGVARTRVGLISEGKIPMRNGAEVFDTNDNPIGVICSGSYSPTLTKNIAFAYINSDFIANHNQVVVRIRTRQQQATICKLPFIQTNYKL